jgi:hypothetical protein
MPSDTRQSGSTRISPLVVAVAASVTIASLIGLGALTGVLPNKRPALRDEVVVPRAEPSLAKPGACPSCGTVESVRTLEVSEDSGPAAGFSSSDPGKIAKKRYAYRVTVRMDDGSFRTVSLSSPSTFAIGDKVRVVDGRLVRG